MLLDFTLATFNLRKIAYSSVRPLRSEVRKHNELSQSLVSGLGEALVFIFHALVFGVKCARFIFIWLGL